MLKQSVKGNSLPSLQKRIILSLAEKGPQTRHEVKESLGSTYKNILFSFGSLEKKGLIHIVGQKKWRRQEFPQFWLAEEGIALALVNGAEPEKLESDTFRFYQGENSDIIDFLCELAKASPSENFYELYLALKTVKGIIQKNDNALLGQALFVLVKKSPAYRKTLEQAFQFWRKLEGVKNE